MAVHLIYLTPAAARLSKVSSYSPRKSDRGFKPARLTQPRSAYAARPRERDPFRFPIPAPNCASISTRMNRCVGMFASAARVFSVASRAAGRRRLMVASLGASSKRTFFISERSYSVRSAFFSQSSASSSVLRSGNGFDITLYLFVVHEANAHGTDLFATPGE